jgi:hypothetical protein
MIDFHHNLLKKTEKANYLLYSVGEGGIISDINNLDNKTPKLEDPPKKTSPKSGGRTFSPNHQQQQQAQAAGNGDQKHTTPPKNTTKEQAGANDTPHGNNSLANIINVSGVESQSSSMQSLIQITPIEKILAIVCMHAKQTVRAHEKLSRCFLG